MKSNCVVLTPMPRGRRIDGIAPSTAPYIYPGTVISVLAGGVGGNNSPYPYDSGQRLPWVPWNLQDNQPGLIAIADVDWFQGKIAANYQDPGRRFPIYFPVPGDELNMRLANTSGSTYDPVINVGTLLAPQDGTGFLVLASVAGTAGGYTGRPFMALENLPAVGSSQQPEFVRVVYTGSPN